MKFVADVHLHSHYSRATSKDLNLEHLAKWAQLKGVTVAGTGDIAHPGWLQEMKEKLEPAEAGLFRLKAEVAGPVQAGVFKACQAPVRFMLAGEISSIYKKRDRVRKVHNIIFAPSFEAVEKIQIALEKIGNIRSDGRPILGLPSRDLLEIILEIDPACYLIPAHIWTPWFSLLGSKSGYDSVEECFEDLTPHIFALETGLSSDPPMNWRVSNLDRYTLVSNSDAHSPPKLAREANLFNTELSYPAIFAALQSGDPEAFGGTLEFFPEEGKYHYDGHRKCEVRWHPQTTLAHQGRCAVCGKPVTVGVMHRIETLADRPEGEKPAQTHPFRSLIPLPEILAEVYQVGAGSKKVQQQYETLLTELGSELTILLDLPLAEIERAGGPLLAEGIGRMRRSEVKIAAGYDGEYGVIKLFEPQERARLTSQLSLLEVEPVSSRTQATPAPTPPGETKAGWTQPALVGAKAQADEKPLESEGDQPADKDDLLAGLNPAQREAAGCVDAPLLIVAGPGTGKTRTLTYRIAYLIAEKGVAPENILAITFTNKAAEEMAGRLERLLGAEIARRLVIKTFHAFGAMLLRKAAEPAGLSPNFVVCSDAGRPALLKQLYPDLSERDLNRYLDDISTAKNQLLAPEDVDVSLTELYQAYQQALRQHDLLDFDDLIYKSVQLLETHPDLLTLYQQRFRWISVDEYQDVNQAQYRLLRLLTGPETNLCVIGDPDQAIYGFRGASRDYFLQFDQDFPRTKTIYLSQNYRSTQPILAASGQVIEKSAGQRLKVWSDFVDKTKLDIYRAATDKAEAEYIVHQIERMVGGTSYFSLDSGRVSDDEEGSRSFADFAVLYRLGAQSQALIEAFERSGMPYQTGGQTPFYDQKGIREIMACLWFLYNRAAAFQLEHLFTRKQVERLISFLNGLPAVESGQTVAGLIEQIAPRLPGLGERQLERIQQLKQRAGPFEARLGNFLEATVLHKETDAYDPRAGRVALMTLHAAKGLEFPVVFIVGCEETLLPYRREGKPFDLEEERRLFYVGMTRARHKLILTHAKTRFLFGQRQQNEPSRFLDDIEQALLEIKRMAAGRKPANKEPDNLQLKLF